MKAQNHSRILGTLYALYAGVLILAFFMFFVPMTTLSLKLTLNTTVEMGIAERLYWLAGTLFIPLFFAVVVIPSVVAAYKLLAIKPGARFWTIFAAVVVILNFPVGTAIGIYSLWFIFSKKGNSLHPRTP